MKNLTIKVGDYVRTKDYGFIKVKSFYYNEDMIHILDENCNEYDFSKELVDDFKSSPNIIDLVEEYDYIKLDGWGNKKLWRVVKAPYGKLMIEDDGWNELEDFEDEKIIGIITHEQMETMEYKIEK